MAWFTLERGWDPWGEMEQLRRDMDRLWEQRAFPRTWRGRTGVFPAVNISEDQDHVYVRAELAGVKPEEIEVTLHDSNLILRGERKIPTEEKVLGYHRREREAGTFRRLIRLPGRLDSAKVAAQFKDGMLTVILSKPEEIKPKQIHVKAV